MSGILNKNILEALYRANFEKITNYIIDICELVVEDYEKRQIKLPNDENKIRSIMLEEYLKTQKTFPMCRSHLHLCHLSIEKGGHNKDSNCDEQTNQKLLLKH